LSSAGAATDRAVPRATDPGWGPPLAIYAGVLVVLLLVSWFSIRQIGLNPMGVPTQSFPGQGFWGGWVRYDGGWYWYIAEVGYSYVPDQQSSVAFFPGYPLAIRGVGRLIDNVPLGGILTTIACGAAALTLFWRWAARLLGPEVAIVAVCALALYPYSWFLYGAVYGDALFLLAAVSAFLLLEKDKVLLAGLAGAVATGTRAVGVAVVAGLVVGVLEQRGAFDRFKRLGRRWWQLDLPRRIDVKKLRPADGAVLLSIGGLVAWSAWLWHRYGDPLLFSSVQEYWGQPSTPRTWLKRDFFATVLRGPDRLYAYGLVVQALFAIGVLLLVPTMVRRLGLRYGVYTLVLVLIPAVGSQDFQGMGRYLIGAFPAFAVIGILLAERPPVRRVALPASGALLVLGTGMFAHGLYLA
jgi:hypothetical protein